MYFFKPLKVFFFQIGIMLWKAFPRSYSIHRLSISQLLNDKPLGIHRYYSTHRLSISQLLNDKPLGIHIYYSTHRLSISQLLNDKHLGIHRYYLTYIKSSWNINWYWSYCYVDHPFHCIDPKIIIFFNYYYCTIIKYTVCYKICTFSNP